MKYYYDIKTNLSFDEAQKKVREELMNEGFGVLTEIDVQETLKKKLDVDYDKYLIPFAYKALTAEKEIGLLLPCNIIIYEQEEKTVIATILPTIAMSMVDNEGLQTIAEEVEQKLKSAIDRINEV